MDIPQGPQLQDADLTKCTDEELYKLATAVSLELQTVTVMYGDGQISSDELLWVRQDAATVQAEFERRGDTVQFDTFSKVLDRLVLKYDSLFDAETVQKARENLSE